MKLEVKISRRKGRGEIQQPNYLSICLSLSYFLALFGSLSSVSHDQSNEGLFLCPLSLLSSSLPLFISLMSLFDGPPPSSFLCISVCARLYPLLLPFYHHLCHSRCLPVRFFLIIDNLRRYSSPKVPSSSASLTSLCFFPVLALGRPIQSN